MLSVTHTSFDRHTNLNKHTSLLRNPQLRILSVFIVQAPAQCAISKPSTKKLNDENKFNPGMSCSIKHSMVVKMPLFSQSLHPYRAVGAPHDYQPNDIELECTVMLSIVNLSVAAWRSVWGSILNVGVVPVC
jgi:hypothetical protein